MGNEVDMNNKSNVTDFDFGKLAKNIHKIDSSLYSKYNVKRGLRNSDGSGVLIGLTEIGDVHGYIIDENEIVPVEGSLRYRGIDVNELVAGFQNDGRLGFEETCYLLMFGELPSKVQLEEFFSHLGETRTLPYGFLENMILKAPSPNIMNKLSRCILANYSYDNDPENGSIENNLRQSIELIARVPTFIAYAYQAKCHYYEGKSLFIHNTRADLSTAEMFLSLIRPGQSFTKDEAELLDLCLVLHAEHGGGNNSSFTTHVVSSADTDIYSAIAAAVGSLKGKKHGGANVQVMGMMNDIKSNVSDWGNEDEIAGYLEKILRKEAYDKTGLIYGMGHAVYTKTDPRAVLLKKRAKELAGKMDRSDEFKLYESIENLSPELYANIKGGTKTICANVDFYSGFVYSMLKIPYELYTPIFAMARITGWVAHRIEELVSGGRIIRPAYKSVSPKKSYVSIHSRD